MSADRFTRDKWLLVVALRTPSEQHECDPESGVFPNDDASKLVRFASDYWSLLPEEIETCVRWTDTRVELTAPLIDNLRDVIDWLIMHLVPLSVTLTQLADEGDV